MMPVRMLGRKINPRLGRRGQVLVLVGAAWILFGISVWTVPTDTPGDVPHEHFPPTLRAIAWVITGCIAVLSAFWPPGKDHGGFAALVAMPLVQAVSFTLSFVFWVLPGWPDGFHKGWVSAIVWATISDIILVVAGWPEPSKGGPPLEET